MKILVLGKNGQVGRAIMRALPPSANVLGVGREQADFETPGALKGVIDLHRPDVIVNAAAYTAVDLSESEPERAWRVNAEAVSEIGAAAAAHKAWVVHYSTDYVFDGGKAEAYLETDDTAPLGVYGASKRGGEVALAAAVENHLIFRTSWVHSATGENFIAKILNLARAREDLSVISDQVGAPTSADLIAAATVKSLEAIMARTPIEAGLYHLSARGATSWHGLASFAVAHALARGARLRATPASIRAITSSAFGQAARRPANSRLDCGKLSRTLGMTLPDWSVGVNRTLDQLLSGNR